MCQRPGQRRAPWLSPRLRAVAWSVVRARPLWTPARAAGPGLPARTPGPEAGGRRPWPVPSVPASGPAPGLVPPRGASCAGWARGCSGSSPALLRRAAFSPAPACPRCCVCGSCGWSPSGGGGGLPPCAAVPGAGCRACRSRLRGSAGRRPGSVRLGGGCGPACYTLVRAGARSRTSSGGATLKTSERTSERHELGAAQRGPARFVSRTRQHLPSDS